MKIKVKLPRKWEEVTWEQALKLIDGKDDADTVSVFVNLKAETLRKSRISNLEEVLSALAFTNEALEPGPVPLSVFGYTLPKNLNFETICRFEDVKSYGKMIFDMKNNGEELSSNMLKDYHRIVAVYAMPNYEDAEPEEREEFAKQFLQAPCTEVMAIGNFTLMKLAGLKRKGKKLFPGLATRMHRLKLVLRGWRSRLAFWLRFVLWKNRHRISDTNYSNGQ